MRAIGLGGVEESDATVEGCPDDVDHLGPGRDRRLVRAAHVLHAETDAETSSEPSLRRDRLAGREVLATDCVASAPTVMRGSNEVAANPRPATRNFRRSGIAGPSSSCRPFDGCEMLFSMSIVLLLADKLICL